MGLFSGLFGKRDKNSELVARVPELIGPFIDCAMMAVDLVEKRTGHSLPDFSKLTILVFAFGGLDELCQALKLDEKDSLRIFKQLLMTKFRAPSEVEAQRLLEMVVRVSAMKEGQRALTTGGQSHADWRIGHTTAPLRLGALLEEDCRVAALMNKG